MSDIKVRLFDVLDSNQLCEHHPDPTKQIYGAKSKILFYYHFGNQVCVCGICHKPTGQCEMEKISRVGFENIIRVKTQYPESSTECDFCPECKAYLDALIKFEEAGGTPPELRCDWVFRIAKFMTIKRQMAGISI